MPLVVQKFGGTSVATAERIMAAARKAIRAKQAGNQVIVVVSARGDTTDELIELAREITEQPPAREMDMLLSTGEQISIALMAMAIQALGEQAISFTGAQVGIVTDSTPHQGPHQEHLHRARMRQALDDGKIVIVAGFQGIDENGNITTLGRGGSDTTAVALAAVMKHDRRSLPRRSAQTSIAKSTPTSMASTRPTRASCPRPARSTSISYDEMLELASVGAGVMHSRSIEFAKKFDVPVHMRCSLQRRRGNLDRARSRLDATRSSCAAPPWSRTRPASPSSACPIEPGVSHRIFAAIADRNIAVDMIAQNVGSDGRARIGFTVPGHELHATLQVLRAGGRRDGRDASSTRTTSARCRSSAPACARTPASPSACSPPWRTPNVNMKMITTGDIKISVLVDQADGVKALRGRPSGVRAGQAAARRRSAGRPGRLAAQRAAASDCPPSEATWRRLTQQLAGMEDIVVSDVLLDMDQGRITIFELPDRPGNCSRIFQAVAAAGIVVDMIVQNPSDRARRAIVQRAACRTCSAPWKLTQRRRQRASTGNAASPRTPNIATPDRAGRRHAHAHRRGPPHVRRPGRARHQHRHDQHQRGARQRRRR